MKELAVNVHRKATLENLLIEQDFQIEALTENVLKVTKADELPVFLQVNEGQIYFEVDLGNIAEIADKQLYFDLLDLNTEILPVSIGINNTNPEDPRLVLVESRETENLDDNEVLNVFSALELAVDKVSEVLKAKIG